MAIPNLKRFQKHVALKMENLANLEKSMPAVEEPTKENLGVNLIAAVLSAPLNVLAGVMEKSSIIPHCATVSKAAAVDCQRILSTTIL